MEWENKNKHKTLSRFQFMRIKHFSLSVGSQVFKCLSEEARLRILNVMSKGVLLTITDLELILDYSQAKTSRHVSYLRNAGLIKNRRVDNYSFYSINDEWSEIISVLVSYIEKDSVLKEDLQNLETLNSNRELSSNKISFRKLQGENI